MKILSYLSGLAVIAIGFAAYPQARGQVLGSDDFDANERDPEKWGAIDYPTGHGQFFDANQRLEYRVASPDLVEGDECARPWMLNRPANSADWEVILDVGNTAVPVVLDRVATFGIEVFNANDLTDYVYVELYASTLDIPSLRRGFKAGLAVDGDDLLDEVPLGDSGHLNVTRGSVRLLFDAAAKVFHAFYDPGSTVNGHTWHKFASFGIGGGGGVTTNANWAMPANADFQVAVYGYSEGMIISGGTVYGDNFSAQTAAASRPTLGLVILHNVAQLSWPASALGYALEGSPTLSSDSWNTITNSPTTIDGINIVQLPVSGMEQFFRLRK